MQNGLKTARKLVRRPFMAQDGDFSGPPQEVSPVKRSQETDLSVT